MEDIDLFIKRLQEEQEIKDFLEKNIYPKSLSKCVANHYSIHKFPELEPSKGLDFKIENIENINNNIKNTFDKLNQFENQIKELIERENEIKKDNCCPICLEEFKPTSYFMPECGHKICLHCFTTNMIKNKSTGGYCCLCREKIIPNV